MKKITTILLLAMLTLGIVGCGNNNSQNIAATDITNATEILTTVWTTYSEDESFYIYGGDTENAVENSPAAFDLTNVEEIDRALCFPADYTTMIDDAASMIHMMNANTFTAGAYHVTNAADLTTVADAIKERTLNNRWMCGFPETLIVVQVGDDYLVSAFGNGDTIETFKTKLQTAYTDNTTVLVEESL